ncbi:class I SAM-dependent methyltransferase [Sediminibacillus albus]|uniref:Methyltransferase domain-containing protein n=1 Tax=Sediminibacillus albus TaxID=407036 RepID=A0A1G9ARY3_9BACI|nr:class I SAM-dependent methyltransferase [Sediminibacillus albus]SDK30086.1 Methyltransferase domain-containing protein [Sediminibacillus albus]
MKQSFNWHQEAEKQWNERASFWNENSRQMWDNGSRKTIIPFISKHVRKEASILDVGCGDGYGSYKLWQAGYAVTGVDLAPEMIHKANRLANNRLMFQQADVIQLSFADESFDGIMAINSLEWTEHPAQALHELDRILKKGGLACVGLLGPTAGPRNNSYPRLKGGKAICNTMMPWELQKLVDELGWQTIDGQGVYKQEVDQAQVERLPLELKQALTFMWLFMFRK